MIDISIDMLSVGNADAIIVWLKDSNNNSYIILIDGGNSSDGERVITHLEQYIFPHVRESAPDLIVSTHHDKDHIGGLIPVVRHYGRRIGEIWINNPADHISSHSYQSLKESFRRKSAQKQFQVITESIANIEELIGIVDRNGITRKPALYGQETQNGIIKVLGPSRQFYTSLLPGMDNIEDYVSSEATYAYNSIFGEASVNEHAETNSPCPIVDEENSTSATNNSSVILQVVAKSNDKYLFTGDAGVQAIEDVEARVSINEIYWLDVPHHGSRRNLSSRLIALMSPQKCFISAKGTSKHPRRALVNCLKRHGSSVYSTHKSGSLWHHRGAFPDRNDYSTATEL